MATGVQKYFSSSEKNKIKKNSNQKTNTEGERERDACQVKYEQVTLQHRVSSKELRVNPRKTPIQVL